MNDGESIEGILRDWLADAERVALIGIGDELRRDDYVGVETVKKLRGKLPKHVLLVESETVPESYLETIAEFRPTHALLIDAGMADLEPGQMKAIGVCSALGSKAAVSTHALPLRVFCEYLETMIGAKVLLVIIQPETTDFGSGLTHSVKEAAEKLAQTLMRILRSP